MYVSKVDQFLHHILAGEFFSSEAVHGYLTHLAIRDLIMGDEEMSREETEFFIKHADDKGDEILVDEEWHITGIVDWEWYACIP